MCVKTLAHQPSLHIHDTGKHSIDCVLLNIAFELFERQNPVFFHNRHCLDAYINAVVNAVVSATVSTVANAAVRSFLIAFFLIAFFLITEASDL